MFRGILVLMGWDSVDNKPFILSNLWAGVLGLAVILRNLVYGEEQHDGLSIVV